MPIIKIGEDNYNGRKEQIFLILGNATRDAETKIAKGYEVASTSIAAGEVNGEQTYVRINGWRDKAKAVGQLKKGETVLVAGKLRVDEYNGKLYQDLDVDFIVRDGAGFFTETDSAVAAEIRAQSSSEARGNAAKTVETLGEHIRDRDAENVNYEDVDDSEGLPF